MFPLVVNAGLLPKQVRHNAIAAARWLIPLHILQHARKYQGKRLLYVSRSFGEELQCKRMEPERQRL